MNANANAHHSAGRGNGSLQLGAGYENRPLEVLWEDGGRVFCKIGHDGSGEQRYAFVPVRSSEHPTPDGINRLAHEYGLKDYLDSAWALRPLELLRERGQTMLVVESPGGDRLDRIFDQPMEIGQFLRLAAALSSALGKLHERGLVHKDIKPANVLANVATGQVWFTGFGVASRLPRERQSPNLPEYIAGTLAYMSPEQTGRMNRSIDSRSDLYSLGITLYEMLTGSLPFTASDPMEWVHCHTARQPASPTERQNNIPASVCAITMKLLAKTAEERYQTAAGAESDFRRCLSEWESKGRIEDFVPGEHDASDRVMIPEKLYGRDREIDILLTAFDRIVAGGRPELVLVSGYSGIGKSAVVNELHKPLVPPRGLFASGKFDQYKRDIPYATLAQAFQSLIRPLLSKAEEDLRKWREALREALEPNGLLIVELVPELKHIIGEQPPVPELPPQEAQGRFQLVFRRFISVFARPEHPLALFLDDLQWLDAATLDLLEDLLTRTDLQHLLLIGAYRDNEVHATHPLVRKLNAIRQAGAAFQDIVLTPLERDDLGQLLADSLHCEPERATPLAELIHEKTTGNPFFVIQFISTLADEGLLTFDYGEGRWVWDLHRIQAKGFTDNIVELMVGKLNRLPAETQKALQQFACMGNSAEFEMLRMVRQGSVEDMHSDLWEAVRLGLIFRADDSYRFLHDRVQEAAYSLIPTDLRAEAHLRIGTLLAAHTPPAKREEAIFEIVNQLNRGSHLIISVEERERVADLNLIAGRRAKVSTAYDSALKYLRAGSALLTEETWEHNYKLVFANEYLMAECELLTADKMAALNRLPWLAQRARNRHDFCAATRLRLTLYTTLDRSDLCVDVFLDWLRRDGTVWSNHPTREAVMCEYERIWALLGNRTIEELIDLPLITDPDVLDTLDVFTEIMTPSQLFDEHLNSLVICRLVTLSLEQGNCDASCFAYVWLAMFAGPRFNNYRDGFRFGQLGYDLVEKRGLTRYQARIWMNMGSTVLPWAKHVAGGRELVRRAFDAAYRIGDLTFASYSWDQLVTVCLAAGDPLAQVQTECENGLAFAKRVRFGLVLELCGAQLGLILTMRGLTPTFGCLDHPGYGELDTESRLANSPNLVFAEFYYWTRKLQAHFFAGDLASAVNASLRAEPLLWTSAAMFESAEYRLYGALVHAAAWDHATENQRQKHFETLLDHRRQLEVWAEVNPETFEDRAAIVGAEIARIEGRLLDAEQLYEKSIRSAHANGFIHNEALANELASQFYRIRGFSTTADAYLRNARTCYEQWGALGKVNQIDARFPHIQLSAASSLLGATIDTSVTRMDAMTVIRASQTLSSEMNLPSLIEKLLRLAVEHAGAQRGLLILLSGVGPYIEAEAKSGHGSVEIAIRHDQVKSVDLPQSVLQYVLRTVQRVLLDDASSHHGHSEDEYVRRNRTRSLLCLPIIKQTKIIGALYLENNLSTHSFTTGRVAVLDLLASQAAISLENARLYSDLQRSEAYLAQGQSISRTGSFGRDIRSGEIYWSEETYKIFELDRSVKPTMEFVFERIHPDDREHVRQAIDRATNEKTDIDFEYRMLGTDGRVKHVHVASRVLKTSPDGLESVGTVTEVTAARQAEDKIRESERELRQVLNFAPQQVAVLGPDLTRLYVNQATLDYFGITLEECLIRDLRSFFHPDDWERMMSETQSKFLKGFPHQAEFRLLRKDGKYRWFLFRYNPLRDEQGRVRHWYVAGTDIEDLKETEERLQKENVALREEIDKTSMFEEIVGTSPPLQAVLSRISKVAPTDSSVLITGETGTGKELVARAIHKRSRRSSRPFVSVNCAVIPHDLIASELFGHEKGSFTGATQRRLGRFEMAEGGTLFLDEIGELPAETQIALLRVLQEHEFERVGGTRSIGTNVRVIAATNRDLESAMAGDTFRSDLFYRLNVFPIEIPPLRERTEDIPMLIEYFIDRYARKAGKRFHAVSKRSIDLLQSYSWPGNIRELQNVIERSVIVCETENFSVDESWLSTRPPVTRRDGNATISRPLPSQEKTIIEAALNESRGKVYGPSGAASKLGIPRSTLESKIRSLRINKDRFKS